MHEVKTSSDPFSVISGKVVAIFFIVLVFIVVLFNCFTIVGPSERGVKVTLGEVDNFVYPPGIVWKAPFVTRVNKFVLQPKTYEVSFEVGDNGAITKDMQTVGATVSVRYTYDENRILEIVKKYANDAIIESAMRDNIKASLKETTGKYSIYALVEEQNKITQEVSAAILSRMSDYPIAIAQTTITNWDWSDDFDKQIKETANRNQQIKVAEAEANIAAAQAQKLVKEAEAKKQAAELDAQAKIAAARGAAEAKKLAADAQAYENQQIAKNMQTMQAQWNYEIELERAKRWNGKQVSDAAYIVPGTGAVVPLTGIKSK